MIEVRVGGETKADEEVPCVDVLGLFSQPRQVVVDVPPKELVGG